MLSLSSVFPRSCINFIVILCLQILTHITHINFQTMQWTVTLYVSKYEALRCKSWNLNILIEDIKYTTLQIYVKYNLKFEIFSTIDLHHIIDKQYCNQKHVARYWQIPWLFATRMMKYYVIVSLIPTKWNTISWIYSMSFSYFLSLNS